MSNVDHSLLIDKPIRAKMAATPETSDFTSIKLRIKAAIQGEQPNTLLPFVGNEHKALPKGLMFSAKDYLQLVDDTGRIVRADKRGSMSQELTAYCGHLERKRQQGAANCHRWLDNA